VFGRCLAAVPAWEDDAEGGLRLVDGEAVLGRHRLFLSGSVAAEAVDFELLMTCLAGGPVAARLPPVFLPMVPLTAVVPGAGLLLLCNELSATVG